MLKDFGLPAGRIQFESHFSTLTGGMTMAHFQISGEPKLLICEIGRQPQSHRDCCEVRYVSSAGHMLDAPYVIADVDLPELVGSLINPE